MSPTWAIFRAREMRVKAGDIAKYCPELNDNIQSDRVLIFRVIEIKNNYIYCDIIKDSYKVKNFIKL